jgi:hypothetical protein
VHGELSCEVGKLTLVPLAYLSCGPCVSAENPLGGSAPNHEFVAKKDKQSDQESLQNLALVFGYIAVKDLD